MEGRGKRNRGAGRAGATLIEVVISVLVIGLICAAIMPVFITSSMSAGKVDRRQAAADALRRLGDELKFYVAADHDPDTGPAGPGTGDGGWDLPGDNSGRWALEEGRHDLDPAMWCPALADYNGSIYYTVTVRDTDFGPVSDLRMTVDWEDK